MNGIAISVGIDPNTVGNPRVVLSVEWLAHIMSESLSPLPGLQPLSASGESAPLLSEGQPACCLVSVIIQSNCQSWEARASAPASTATANIDGDPGKPYTRKDLSGLLNILLTKFSESEVKILCFHLGVEYEELAGSDKALKVIELIKSLQRRERLGELIEIGRKVCPRAEWPGVPN
jgi:hypothetical protein